MGQFSNSFPKHLSYLCEYAIRLSLSCSFCEYPFIFHCLHCSPSCFDPDSLLPAHLWLGLSWIYCSQANKSFSSRKTSSRKPYTSSKQQERQKHSVETTINFSRCVCDPSGEQQNGGADHTQLLPREPAPHGRAVTLEFTADALDFDNYGEEYEYTAERILSDKPDSSTPGGRLYKVRWKGFAASRDSWEPPSSFLPPYTSLWLDYLKAKKINLDVKVLWLQTAAAQQARKSQSQSHCSL